jgi:Polyketide cyclase / dehydrase and lipid transport
MQTWTTYTTLPASPAEALTALTDPVAITRWSPFPFEILELDGQRLSAGGSARVSGRLAGRDVEFAIDVLEAHHERVALIAEGPISLDVEYRLHPIRGGSEIHASVGVQGSGLLGRVLATATGALLGAGALKNAVARLARALEPAIAA